MKLASNTHTHTHTHTHKEASRIGPRFSSRLHRQIAALPFTLATLKIFMPALPSTCVSAVRERNVRAHKHTHLCVLE